MRYSGKNVVLEFPDDIVAFVMLKGKLMGYHFYEVIYKRARHLIRADKLDAREIHITHWNSEMRLWAQRNFSGFKHEALDVYVFCEKSRGPNWDTRVVECAKHYRDHFAPHIVGKCNQINLIQIYDALQRTYGSVPKCVSTAIHDDVLFAPSLCKRMLDGLSPSLELFRDLYMPFSKTLLNESMTKNMYLNRWQQFVNDLDPVDVRTLPFDFDRNVETHEIQLGVRTLTATKVWYVSGKYSLVDLYDRLTNETTTVTLRRAMELMGLNKPQNKVCTDDDVVDAHLIRAFKLQKKIKKKDVYVQGVKKSTVQKRLESLIERGFVEETGPWCVYVP